MNVDNDVKVRSLSLGGLSPVERQWVDEGLGDDGQRTGYPALRFVLVPSFPIRRRLDVVSCVLLLQIGKAERHGL